MNFQGASPLRSIAQRSTRAACLAGLQPHPLGRKDKSPAVSGEAYEYLGRKGPAVIVRVPEMVFRPRCYGFPPILSRRPVRFRPLYSHLPRFLQRLQYAPHPGPDDWKLLGSGLRLYVPNDLSHPEPSSRVRRQQANHLTRILQSNLLAT